MTLYDLVFYAFRALLGHKTRSVLTLVAMAIGVAAVVILTALGEGARQYVIGEFSSLGSNLVIVLPGRAETKGGGPQMLMGETPRDLTLADATSLLRIPAVRRIAPLNVGEALVSYSSLQRNVPILGTTSEFLDIRRWRMLMGSFLPEMDPESAASLCVLGAKVRTELFGNRSPLGEWIRIGDRRFRVIGVLASEGRSIGTDVDEIVIIPVASAQMLFNTPSLFRIMVEAKSRTEVNKVKAEIARVIRDRHQGEEDVTIITQDAVLSTFDRILRALTLTVGGIAAISLVVAGILIMNVMLVSVAQRRNEIGILMAVGASRHLILGIFLFESALLSLFGAMFGLMVGVFGTVILGMLYPALAAGAPWWASTAATTLALATGLLFGYLPARRAAHLEPVAALARR